MYSSLVRHQHVKEVNFQNCMTRNMWRGLFCPLYLFQVQIIYNNQLFQRVNTTESEIIGLIKNRASLYLNV